MAILKISQAGRRRSKKMCSVSPSHTISPPRSMKMNSISNRSDLSGVSIRVERRRACCSHISSGPDGTDLILYFRSSLDLLDCDLIQATLSIFTWLIATGVFGRSLRSRGTLEILFATSCPSTTSPKIVCRLSSHGVGATVIKNWLPLVFGPEFAIDNLPGLACCNDG